MSAENESAPPPGTGGELVLVATPIGNLGDFSPRARQALASADLVCCEDTRRTRQLLSAFDVRGRRLISLHGHNEAARVSQVLAVMETGGSVAVVSDAGMPAVSDPGARLVAAAIGAGFNVTVVPGPSAVLAALVASGLATDRFCFEGFLPRRGGVRLRRLQQLATEERTVVLFEAPLRVPATLADLAAVCGPDRPVAVARELTKMHEELWRGSVREASAHFGVVEVRGEVVIVLGGAPPATEPEDAVVVAALEAAVARGESRRDAAAGVSSALGVSHRRAYSLVLGLDVGGTE